jgi:hypothetical protein
MPLIEPTRIFLLSSDEEIPKDNKLNPNILYIKPLERNNIQIYFCKKNQVETLKAKLSEKYIAMINQLLLEAQTSLPMTTEFKEENMQTALPMTTELQEEKSNIKNKSIEINETSTKKLFNKILRLCNNIHLPNESFLIPADDQYQYIESSIPLNDDNLCDSSYLPESIDHPYLDPVKNYVKTFIAKMTARNIDDRPSFIANDVQDFFTALLQYCESAETNRDIAKLKLALIAANIWSCSIGKKEAIDDQTLETLPQNIEDTKKLFLEFYSQLKIYKNPANWKMKDYIYFIIQVEKSCAKLNELMVFFRQKTHFGHGQSFGTQQINKLVKDWEFNEPSHADTLQTLIKLEQAGFFLEPSKSEKLRKMLIDDQELNQTKLMGLYKTLYQKPPTCMLMSPPEKTPDLLLWRQPL